MLYVFLATLALGVASCTGSVCEKQCTSSFPLHTFPKKESFYACLRGCRLERIEQVSKNWAKKLAAPEKNCEKDCTTAYGENIDSKNACIIGCRSAEPAIPTQETMLKAERSKAGLDNGGHFFIIRPVLVMRRYCSGLYKVAVSFIGQRTAVVGNEYSQSVAIEIVEEPRYLRIESIADVSYLKSENRKDIRFDAQEAKIEGLTWLGCVSYKAGLPKWLLASALVISVSAIIYLFFSICCEPDSEKVHKFDGSFDRDFEDTFAAPLLVEQAPPLPPKYAEKGGIL